MARKQFSDCLRGQDLLQSRRTILQSLQVLTAVAEPWARQQRLRRRDRGTRQILVSQIAADLGSFTAAQMKIQ